jgi:hypothetical protein
MGAILGADETLVNGEYTSNCPLRKRLQRFNSESE